MGSVAVQASGQGSSPSTPDFQPVSLRVGDKEWPWEACVQASSGFLRSLMRWASPEGLVYFFFFFPF